MDFLNYREKLGIGINDESKFKYFKVKIFNILWSICDDSNSECLDAEEYFNFCNSTGTELDYRLTQDIDSEERMRHCVNVLDIHTSYLTEFLPYLMAFINSVKVEKHEGRKRIDFVNLAKNMMDESHIPYELLEENDEYFIFPKGVPELDAALVSEPLEWLNEYPKTRKEWIAALKEYSSLTDENASDVADKFRKALERFFQEFFNSSKTLENMKSEYGTYMKAKGVPAELSNNLETIQQSYTNFINGYAKHHDKTSKNLLEYIMYQTGNIIRLLITLKTEAENDAY